MGAVNGKGKLKEAKKSSPSGFVQNLEVIQQPGLRELLVEHLITGKKFNLFVWDDTPDTTGHWEIGIIRFQFSHGAFFEATSDPMGIDVIRCQPTDHADLIQEYEEMWREGLRQPGNITSHYDWKKVYEDKTYGDSGIDRAALHGSSSIWFEHKPPTNIECDIFPFEVKKTLVFPKNLNALEPPSGILIATEFVQSSIPLETPHRPASKYYLFWIQLSSNGLRQDFRKQPDRYHWGSWKKY